MTTELPTRTPAAATVPGWTDVAVFLAIAFSLPWLLWLLRLLTGIDVLAAGAMVAVGVATFVTVCWVRRPASITRETGLTPARPFSRLLAHCALALAIVVGLAVLAILIGALAGVTPLDLLHFSAAREAYGAPAQTPVAAMLLAALAQTLLLFVVLLPLAFCEEWGWRGFLFPRLLLRLGTWPALAVSGLIWALWHLPGYVGAGARVGLVPFIVFCVLFGTVLGWLRLRSQSVWPTTVAHAANNTIVTGLVNVSFLDAEAVKTVNPWIFGFGGWPGWLLMSALIAYLALTGRLRNAATSAQQHTEERGRRSWLIERDRKQPADLRLVRAGRCRPG